MAKKLLQKGPNTMTPTSPMSRIVTWDYSARQLRNFHADAMGNLIITGQDGNVQFALDEIRAVAKTDVTVGTGGAYNALFGADTWAQIIQQQNLLGALPKAGWPRSGFRVQSSAAISSGAGIAEGGAVPTSVIPTYVEVTVPPKEFAARTQFTRMFDAVAGKDDTISWDEHLRVFQANFMNAFDVDLHVNMGTLAGNNVESIDRVCGSSVENTAQSYDTADEDLHGVDRSANTWFNANSLQNGGTDRTLSITLINQLLSGQLPYWETGAKGAFYETGYTTWSRWSELLVGQQRFGETTLSYGAEGAKGVAGAATGLKTLTWDGIPLVMDSHVQTDTIDRINLIHGDYVSLRWGLPLESIVNTDPFVVQFVKAMALHGIGELVCPVPKAQGKLMDLK